MPTSHLTAIAAGLRRMYRPLTLAGVLMPGFALANPAGGVVVAGDAAIGASNGNGLHITQTSHAAAINWREFSIGADEYVVFHQPSASATVLNRVVGGLPSEILGNLSANGRVFLINPAGVVFGKGSQVDVGSLVASTLDIADQDFMSGRYVFAGDSTAAVSNAGTINAADGGFVLLAGDRVSNSGLIQAQLGDVALSSGSAVTLGFDPQGHISFTVDAAALSAQAGVDNLGSLIADGGRVILDAQVAQGLVSTAVNNRGRVQAQGIEEREGEIYLNARGGDVRNDGIVDASGVAGANGGRIGIRGDRDIRMGDGSAVRFDGHAGGTAHIVAERNLLLSEGSIVDGRGASGAGGFLEISGYEGLRADGELLLGAGGRLLIDPAHLEVSGDCATSTAGACFTAGQIADQLNVGTNVALIASDRISFASGGSISAYGGGELLLGIGAPETDGAYGGAFPNSSGVTSFVRGPASEGNGDILMAADQFITIGGGFQASGASDTGDVRLGRISAAEITIESAGLIETGDLQARDFVHAQATGGGISTGAISVNGGSFFQASIDLSARDGISTGNLSAIHRASAENQSLFSRIAVHASNPAGTTSAGGNISTGALSASTDANGFQGVTADSHVQLLNEATQVVDADGQVTQVGGGSIATGAVTLTAAASAAPSTCLDCVPSAGAVLSVHSERDVSLAGVVVDASGPIPEHVDNFVVVSSANGGTITPGVIRAGANAEIDLFSDMRDAVAGTGAIVLDGLSGSVQRLGIAGAGSVRVLQDISAGQMDLNAGNGSIQTANLASEQRVDMSADGGSITTGAITVDGGSLFQSSIDLAARDGISTGNLSATHRASAENQALFSRISVRANDIFGSPGSGEITTGSITALTVANGAAGVSADASVQLHNDAQFVSDPDGGQFVGGGSVSTGLITAEAQGSAGGGTLSHVNVDVTAERSVQLGSVRMLASNADDNRNGFLNVFSANAGSISTGSLQLGNSTDVNLFSSSPRSTGGGGTGTIDLGAVTGELRGLAISAAGAVNLGSQALNAHDLSVHSEQGTIVAGDLTAREGSVRLTADAGSVLTGNISATGSGGSLQESTTGSAGSGSAEIFVDARDSITTGDLAVTTRATGNDQFLSGTIALTASSPTDSASAGGSLSTGAVSVVVETGAFQGVSAHGNVQLFNQAIETSGTDGQITRVGGGNVSTGPITIVAPASSPSSTCVDCIPHGSAHLSVHAEDDVNLAGVTLNASGPSAEQFDNFVFVSSANGGNISTGSIDVGLGGDIDLVSHMRDNLPGTGTIAVGGVNGTVHRLGVFGAGAVSLNQNVSAGEIHVSANNGNVQAASLTATQGFLSVNAAAGSINTGALSANASPTAFVQAHARDSITTSNVSALASATADNQNLHAVINLSLAPNAPNAAGGDIVTGALKAETIPGSFSGVSGNADVTLSNHAFQSDGGETTALATSGIGGAIRTGDILINAGGNRDNSADVFLIADGNISVGSVQVRDGNSPFSQVDLVTQRGGDIQFSLLDVGAGTGVHLNALNTDETSTDFGNINLGPITGGSSLSAFADGTLLVDRGTAVLDLGNASLGGGTVIIRAGSLTFSGSAHAQDSLQVSSSSTANLSGASLHAQNGVQINAGTALTMGNVNLSGSTIDLRAGSMGVSGTLDALHQLHMTAPGVISTVGTEPLKVFAGAVAIDAGEIKLANSTFSIGFDTVSLGTDAGLISALPVELRPSTAAPNAAFQGRNGNGVTLGTLNVAGGYIFVRSPGFFSGKIGRGTSSASLVKASTAPLLFNLRPFNAGDGMDVSAFGNSLQQFTETTTFVFGGSGHTGDIFASQPIDFGSSSVALQTSGSIDAGAIKSSGQVLIIGGAQPPPPPPPADTETVQETQSVISAVSSTFSSDSGGTAEDRDDEGQGSADSSSGVEIADNSFVDETSDAPGDELQCR